MFDQGRHVKVPARYASGKSQFLARCALKPASHYTRDFPEGPQGLSGILKLQSIVHLTRKSASCIQPSL